MCALGTRSLFLSLLVYYIGILLSINASSIFAVLFNNHFYNHSSFLACYSNKLSQWITGVWFFAQDTGSGRASFAIIYDSDTTWNDDMVSLKVDPAIGMNGLVSRLLNCIQIYT